MNPFLHFNGTRELVESVAALAALVFPLVFALPSLVLHKQDSSGMKTVHYMLSLVTLVGGILLPLVWFALSCSITPEWKGACQLGWLDGFMVSKCFLGPLVLWAALSLYAFDVLEIKGFGSWLPLGLASGVVVSSVCLLHGFACVPRELGGFMIVPCYTPLWYGFALQRALQLQKPSLLSVRWASIAPVPLWLASLWFSYKTYILLPDQPPENSCVTTVEWITRCVRHLPGS